MEEYQTRDPQADVHTNTINRDESKSCAGGLRALALSSADPVGI